MRRYIIRYRDEDPCSPTFSVKLFAADRARAEERFFDGPDAEGWVIVDIKLDKGGL